MLKCWLVCALRVELYTPQLTALLDSESCEAVIQRAVTRNDRHALRLLCRCNVVQALDVAAVERLMSAAVNMGAICGAEAFYAHKLIEDLSMLPSMCLTCRTMKPPCGRTSGVHVAITARRSSRTAHALKHVISTREYVSLICGLSACGFQPSQTDFC